MKYKKHTLKKIYDISVMGGFYYEIYNEKNEFLVNALNRGSAKDYIDSGYDENYL